MKVVTFGEIMLRLAPEGYLRFTQADKFGVVYGGGEANVSVSLANYGVDSAFVTKLPKHEIGQSAVNALRRYGVDTSMIVRGGDRIGIYFNEKGASQRPSKVIYDRAYSAIAMASPEDFDWDKIFDGADWFHFTGITPALNPTVAGICLDACRAAKAQINWYFGLPVGVAAVSSVFGVRALFTGMLTAQAQRGMTDLMITAGAMILLLCVVEWIYMAAVKRSSSKYLLTLMAPEREE